ncbi:MAG TPA: hypothetical protein VMR45_03645 [Patescibacteria group bacterium]|jgi:N-acyl-L-homoserine lactone synthetase|nr:hypothetical protein [Patescibacteria group bacterium]
MAVVQEKIIGAGISKRETTVPVDVDIFADNPNATFYIGVVATPDGVKDATLCKAAARLRHRVYIQEKGLMHPDAQTLATGLEIDSDDDRSVRFVAIKNNGADVQPHVVGNIRLVVKQHMGDKLPVESLFPEAFPLGEVALGGVEISRFISRSEDRREQHCVARALIRAAAVRTATQYEQPAYAVADRMLLGMLAMDRVPYKVLAEPKVLEEYSTPRYNLPNTAISMDTHAGLAVMTGPDAPPDIQNMYHGLFAHQGLGYFDANMVQISTKIAR